MIFFPACQIPLLLFSRSATISHYVRSCYLQVRVDLTQEGEQRWREVGAVVFEAIHLLQAASDAALLDAWHEQQTMANIKFEHSEVGTSIDEATSLCLKVHRYGAAYALTAGRQLSDNLNVAAVREVLGGLIPHRCVAVRTSRSFKVSPESPTSQSSPSPSPSLELGKKEPWYGVRYGETPLDSALVDYWANNGPLPVSISTAAAAAASTAAASVNDATQISTAAADITARALALPQPNPYLPSDLVLVSSVDKRKEAEQQRAELLRLASGLSGASNDKAQLTLLDSEDPGGSFNKQGDKSGGGASEEDYTCTCGDELFNNSTLDGAATAGTTTAATAIDVAASIQKSSKASWCLKHPISTDPGAFASKGYRHTVTTKPQNRAAVAPANAVLAAAPSLLPPPVCVFGSFASKNYTIRNGSNGSNERNESKGGDLPSDTAVASGDHISPTTSSPSLSSSLWWDLWAKTDATYARPKASLYVALASPVARDNPALTALMARLLSHTLQQRLYDADIAGE